MLSPSNAARPHGAPARRALRHLAARYLAWRMVHDARIVDIEAARALQSEAQAFARLMRRARTRARRVLVSASPRTQRKAALAAMEPCAPRD